MRRWAAHLSAFGTVVTLDYPYARAGRKLPDRLPVLIEAHRQALHAVRREHPGPVVLAGKSMGSRVACHLSLDEEVRALLCLGYPLVGRGGAVRDEVLLALRTPVLFVQGTRDPLCPLGRLDAVRGRMTAPSALHLIEGGDHSLEVPASALRARGQSQAEAEAQALDAIGAFLASPGRG
jgi:predicted alpha/beta-hydrolase family hydrolase